MRAFIVLMAIVLLTACTSGTSNPEQWDPGKKTTLTVLTYNERIFKEQYGTPFSIKNGNITLITKLPGPGEANWEKEIAEKQPDLLHITKEQYIELVEQGLLYDLEPMLKEEGWNPEGLHPAVLQLLRDNIDGVMYGGAATLQSKALYYNAGLFRQYGVPLPEDHMTWEQVYDQASLFQGGISEDEPIYGYSSQEPSVLDQLLQIGRSEGLSLFSPDGKQFLLNTESWKSIYGQLAKALKTGAVFTLPSSAYSPETQYRNHPFVMGKSAMFAGDTSYLSIINSQAVAEEKKIDWGVVTLPQGSSQSGSNPEYQLFDIIAVSKEAAQLGAAKAFIKFIMGEEWARENAEANPYSLLARSQLQKEEVVPERRLDPFFSLDSIATLEGMQISDEVMAQIEDIVLEETEQAISGTVTVEAALQSIQARGQAILDNDSQ